MRLHLPLLLAYAVLLVGLGPWVGRRVRSADAFFVAGRTLGPGLLFATVMAANIGAGSTVGAAGLEYRDGLSAFWWVGAAGIGSLIQAFWIGPRTRRIAAAHGLRTVGDYVELRFGRPRWLTRRRTAVSVVAALVTLQSMQARTRPRR